MNDEAVYEVTLPDGTKVHLAFWFSDNPAASEGCDACIGYEVYADGECQDGGEMDYDSEAAGYDDIADALKDILAFAMDITDPSWAEPSGMSLDDLRDRYC